MIYEYLAIPITHRNEATYKVSESFSFDRQASSMSDVLDCRSTALLSVVFRKDNYSGDGELNST